MCIVLFPIVHMHWHRRHVQIDRLLVRVVCQIRDRHGAADRGIDGVFGWIRRCCERLTQFAQQHIGANECCGIQTDDHLAGNERIRPGDGGRLPVPVDLRQIRSH